MSRMAGTVLLVIAGLAVGLWLGFNPRAHQEVIHSWDQAQTAIAHMKFNSTANVRVAQPPTARTKPSSTPPATVSITWKQVTTAFDDLWLSMQRLWLNVSARIGLTR